MIYRNLIEQLLDLRRENKTKLRFVKWALQYDFKGRYTDIELNITILKNIFIPELKDIIRNKGETEDIVKYIILVFSFCFCLKYVLDRICKYLI